MNKWIKYLLPVILTVAFWNCTDENESSVPEYTAADISIVESSYQSNFSETESEPCLPRQISCTKNYRVCSAARRSAGYQRCHLESFRVGKSITIHSSLIEPFQKLLSLGRLII